MEKAHMFCSYWGFALMCIHLGTHWGMMLAAVDCLHMMTKSWDGCSLIRGEAACI